MGSTLGYMAITFLGIPAAALTLFLMTIGAIPNEYVGLTVGVLVVAIIILMTLETIVAGYTYHPSEQWFGSWTDLLKQQGTHWIDIYASKDPIPAGPIIRPDSVRGSGDRRSVSATIPESHEIHNRGSILTDHTSYGSNLDEFIPLVVTSITKHSRCSLPLHDLTPKDGRSIESAARLRGYRVNFLKVRRMFIILSMLAVVTNTDALSYLGSAVIDLVAKAGDLFQGNVLAPSRGQRVALGINPMAAGLAFALLSYGLLLSLFAWTCSLIDARAVQNLTWRHTSGEEYIGRPSMLPYTRKGEVKFTDYMLRLLPWLGVSIAIAVSFPKFAEWLLKWQADPLNRALAQVLLLTMVFALADTLISYWRRQKFVRKVMEARQSE
jgi:hypothetical protein